VVIRTRVFDDWLTWVTTEEGLRQVVIVGAGMDTRSFRLGWPAGTTVWELDRQKLLELKERCLEPIAPVLACERRTVGVDLELEDWPDRLRAAGFDSEATSAWLAEGFLVYLEEPAVDRILARITSLAAPGGRLAADLVSRDFLNHQWMAPYLAQLERLGTPWRFGTNEPEALLVRHGWRATVTEAGEEGANFGRWPWPVAPRGVPGFPRSFFADAIRAEAAGAAGVPPTAGATARPLAPAGAPGVPSMSFEDYDPGYPAAFERLVERIRSVLPIVRIEHVGSTSIPGLGGRRVLDVVIPAETAEHERIRATLLELGFADFPWAHVKPMLRGAVQHGGVDYPILLYILAPDHEYVRGWIAFREHMRRHPEEAERYAEVKRAAIYGGSTDPWSYQQAKAPYLEDLWERIRG